MTVEHRRDDALRIRGLFLEHCAELLLYASRWVRVCNLGSNDLAEDLVHDALLKLCSDAKPAGVPPLAFLKMCIKGDACRRARHAARFPKVPLDSELGQRSCAPDEAIDHANVQRQVLEGLRRELRRRDDLEALEMLGAFARGTTTRSEVSRELGMTKDRYARVRRRILRCRASLPRKLRTTAREVLAHTF